MRVIRSNAVKALNSGGMLRMRGLGFILCFTLALILSAGANGITVSNVTNKTPMATTVWILWNVSSEANNTVEYSINPDLSNASFSAWNNNTSSPKIKLWSLQPNTTYYYRVWSYNVANESDYASSSIYNFTTRECVSYKSVNATDTSITGIDHPIQEAIDSLCLEGGIVELAPGIHDVNNTIVINKNNITIQGTHESVIRVNDRDKPAFVIPHENPSPEEDWENMPALENFTFKGFNVTSSYTERGNTLILAWNIKNITVEDIQDDSYLSYLIMVNPTGGYTSARSEDILVKDNYCLHSGFICFCFSKNIHVIGNTLIDGIGNGIDINRNNEYVYIYNNTIFDGGYNFNIRGHGGNYVYIENNALFGGSQRCISCDGLSNTVMKNNIMTGAWWAAIHIKVQWGLSNISIVNNRIYNNSGHGIWTTQYSYNFKEENTDVTLTNNVIANNGGDGIRMTTKWVQFKNISNNIITNNGGYGINYMDTVEPTTIKYNDVWNNSLGNYNNTTPGTGDISKDPLFVDPNNGDFHLKSQAGRWNGTDWVNDNETSPCIDAGDPADDYSKEPQPNGGRINMGTYGNTGEASKTYINCTDEGSDGIADGIVTVCRDTSCYCRCDGVDDHIEINQATAYINSIGGGTVHLKAGTYIINDSINILSNVIFEGDSQDSTIIKLKDQNNRANWNLIYGDGVTNCILQNFTLDGNRGNQSGVDQNDNIDGIHFYNSDNITVQYVTSKNQMTDNFEFTSTSDSIVQYCTAKDSSHDGFRLGSCERVTFADNLAWNLGAHGIRVAGNTRNSIFERNRLYAGDYGILINTEGSAWCGNNIYRNNYIDNTKFANFAAICIESEISSTIENETFIRNMLDTCWGHGFYIFTIDSSQIKNIKIINNVINKMGGSGIYIKPEATVNGIIARNNIIVNNGARHNEGYGIYGNVTSEYNNIWNNVNGSYGGGASAGIGDISEDPLFANPAVWNENITGGVSWGWSKMMEYYTPQEDFHLKSQAGRWNGSAWVKDNETSPCIDAGDPADDYSKEPQPNGGRINMGTYGNTGEASKTYINCTDEGSDGIADGIVTVCRDTSCYCRCDGVDDHIEINQATAYINSIGGGTVHLKSGTYIISESITIYDNTIFEGDGWSTVIKLVDHATNPPWVHYLGMLDIKQRDNVTIQNLKIDGNMYNQDFAPDDWEGQPIVFHSCTNCTVQNTYILHGNCDSISTYYVEGTGKWNEDMKILNNTLEQCSHNQLQLSTVKDLEIRNNTFIGAGNSAMTLHYCYNCTIANNVLMGTGWTGMQFMSWGHPGSKNIKILDNVITGNPSAGIYLWAQVGTDAEDVEITGNIIHNCFHPTDYVPGWGIHVETYKNVTISNNVLYNNSYGVHAPGSEVVVVKNNIVVNNIKSGFNGSNIVSTYNDVWDNGVDYSGCSPGTGDISVDPLFADVSVHDFHLKSTAGRWNGTDWVNDNETSPCIDAGDPSEKDPDGTRINMGAYGGTSEASKSPSVATGTISGKVTDKDTGAPIEGAVVSTNGYSNTTDDSGNYSITLPTGNYTVTASKTGYQSQSKSAEVFENQTTEVNFTLTVATTTTTTTSTTTTSTTTTLGTTTTTTIWPCDLPGDYPPCGEVTLEEVVDFILLWAQGQAELGDVVNLINAWAGGPVCELPGDYPPCGEITLEEVVDFINLWVEGQADLGDVVNLINAWAGS